MLELKELLSKAVKEGASDVHLTVGLSPIMRLNGALVSMEVGALNKEDTLGYINTVLKEELEEIGTFESALAEYILEGQYDIAYTVPQLGRFRVNMYKQKGIHALVFRLIGVKIPTLEDLKMPEVLREVITAKRGLVLITGPTGSGKSTTLAAMIDEINRTRDVHILTLEDPIEHLHNHCKSMVHQRELGRDTQSYGKALRAALREDPDVILVGEMRDLETISTVITAAETGHLVLSTLHTIGAAKTVDRIIDVFPTDQQQQIKVQLASVLKAVISQQLIPTREEDDRVAALEVMVVTTAVQNLIREGKTHQIDSVIQTGSAIGMKTMDASLRELYKKGIISYDIALDYAIDRKMLEKALMN